MSPDSLIIFAVVLVVGLLAAYAKIQQLSFGAFSE